jgi:hypothetical protein
MHIEGLEIVQRQEDFYVTLPPFFLNQSRWKSYQDCNRLYGWYNIENLVPSKKKGYFEIGTAVHKAQEYAHAHNSTEEAYKKATELAVQTFTKGMGVPQLPGDQEEIDKGVETLRKLLPAYQKAYAQTGRAWKPLGMELAFRVEVGDGTGVWLVGRIDNLVTFLNGLWLVDYKTMSKLDMRTFMQYEIDVQLTAYIYGGTKQLSLDAIARGEKPVMIRGAIIDGMVKTTIPQFHREMYTRSVQDLREFELEWCMKVWEIAAKHAILAGDKTLYNTLTEKMWALGREAGWKVVFPKNTQQCFRYGTCSHRELCVADNEVRRLAFTKRPTDYVDDARATATKAREASKE